MADVMRIGITGAKGFIGKRFSEYLSQKSIESINYDCNLANLNDVENMFSDKAFPNILVHLAGRFTGPDEVLLRDNLLSINNLLSVLKENPKTHLVFGSSGAVYGNSGDKAICELTPCLPNTKYGLYKLYCEQSIQFHESLYGIKSTILRLPSVYGSDNSKGIIFNWLQGAANENCIIINGNGNQKRSFINIDDVSNAIYEVINKKIYGTYNVSHPEIYDLVGLSKIFNDIFSVNIKYQPGYNLLESMVLSSSKLQSISKWKPKIGLRQYLESQKI